jgi:hypothetical protein
MEKSLNVSYPELGIFAATRGMIGFGAGLLVANKLSREKRKFVGLPLLVGGLLTTIPIAMHLFSDRSSDGDASRGDGNGETLAEGTAAAPSYD